MNDIMSFGFHRLWKKELGELLNPSQESLVLDLAAGSGDITKLIKEKNCNCIAYDENIDMLNDAKKKLANYQVDFVNGTAENLPFQNSSFDFVIASFGIRNFSDMETALIEINRILKKKGKFLCLEFSEVNNPVLRKVIKFYYKVIPRYGKFFVNNKLAYSYLIKSIEEFPNQIQFTKKLKKTHFKNIKVIDILDGVASIHISEK